MTWVENNRALMVLLARSNSPLFLVKKRERTSFALGFPRFRILSPRITVGTTVPEVLAFKGEPRVQALRPKMIDGVIRSFLFYLAVPTLVM